MKKPSIFTALTMGSLVLGACAEPDPGDPQDDIETKEQEAFFHAQSFTSPNIQICWVDELEPPTEVVTRLQATLSGEFASRTRLRFSGFIPCSEAAPDANRIEVSYADYNLSEPGVVPACEWTSGIWTCTGQLRISTQDLERLEYVLSRDVAFVLGLNHEDTRDDGLSQYACNAGYDGQASTNARFGPYDPNSIANACATWRSENNDGHLTVRDVQALNWRYGSPGEFVMEGPSMFRYFLAEDANGTPIGVQRCHVTSGVELDAFNGEGMPVPVTTTPYNGSYTYTGDCAFPPGIYTYGEQGSRYWFGDATGMGCRLSDEAQYQAHGGAAVALAVPQWEWPWNGRSYPSNVPYCSGGSPERQQIARMYFGSLYFYVASQWASYFQNNGWTVDNTSAFYVERYHNAGRLALRQCRFDYVSSPNVRYLFTTDPNCEGGWEVGILGYVWPTQVAGTVPLYRLGHPGGYHFMTTNWWEMNWCVNNGWVQEANVGYVNTTQAP